MLKAIAVRPFLAFRFGAPKLKRRLHHYSSFIEHRVHQADCASSDLRQDWNMAAQPVPNYDVDQRVSWWLVEAATLKRCGERLRAQQPSNAAVRKVRSPLGR